MRTVSAARTFPATVHDAETRWYDTGGWPSWVDGLSRIVELSAGWPEVGTSVVWQSGPAGRGQVSERVTSYQPGQGQTVEVQDDSIAGEQSVAFTPGEGSVTIELTLRYRLKRQSIVTPLIDFLFIRRAMATSLNTTLTRFGSELGR
jgi:hypothetical protein